MNASYAVDITVRMQRLDNKRLTPEESSLVEQMHAAAQAACAKVMAEHDQQVLAVSPSIKADY